MIALLLLACGTETLPEYAYGATWTSVRIPGIDPGERLYVADFSVPLRAAPGDESGPPMPLGTPVRVVGVQEPTTLGGFSGRWVEVTQRDRRGFVFSSEITPVAGQEWEWTWTLGFAPDYQPRLRLKNRDEPVELELDVDVTSDRTGGVPSATVSIDRGGWEWIVSLCLVDPAAVPQCRDAIVGLDYEDRTPFLVQRTPPDRWQWTRTQPALLDCDDTVSIEADAWKAPEPLLEFEVGPTLLGRSPEVSCRAVATVSTGTYAGHDLVLCEETDHHDGTSFYARFVALESDRWAYLPCGSDKTRDIASELPHQRISVVDGGPLVLKGPFGPPLDPLLETPAGSLVFDGLRPETLPDGPAVVEHAQGSVRRHTLPEPYFEWPLPPSGSTGLGVARPEGGFAAYVWRPAERRIDWKAGKAPPWDARRYDEDHPRLTLDSVGDDELEQVGTAGTQPVMVFAADSPRWAAIRAAFQEPESGWGHQELVFVRDPWGGLVLLHHPYVRHMRRD